MKDTEKGITMTDEQREYFETVAQLPPDEQAKAASFAAGLMAAARINEQRPA